ncbi:MAG: 50S ribosomal protein L22 [Clostridia bacterium]|jgi:large subunit ribosomal protein L22|nr:50S ribosomal protein L22 [Clostridia bacterium]
MEAKAYLKFVRITPRKVQIVLDLIRGKNVKEAMAILNHTQRGASPLVAKLLKSAVANAEHNFQMNTDALYVSQCFVCPGPTLKRGQARGRGGYDRLLKRTSHVTIAVKEK